MREREAEEAAARADLEYAKRCAAAERDFGLWLECGARPQGEGVLSTQASESRCEPNMRNVEVQGAARQN